MATPMMARSSFARMSFCNIKPYHSQITRSFLHRPVPSIRGLPPCFLPPVSTPSYSTKPSPEAVRPQRNVSSSSSSTTLTGDTKPFDFDISLLPPTNSLFLLNPPPSARPPPWDLPAQGSKGLFAHLFALGKASLGFYKTGIKAIYGNYKLTREIRSRVGEENRRTPRIQLLGQGLISRGEYQLIQRTYADISRAPLFALIFAIFSEWTPVVVVAFSSAVPRTLWIPKQVEKARTRLEARRELAKAVWPAPVPPTEAAGDTKTNPARLQREKILGVGRMLGMYPEWWDRYLPSWMVPVNSVKNRVQRRLDELWVDDLGIERDGGVAKLEGEEVLMAAEARGLDVVDRDVSAVRDDLTRWIKARKHRSRIELIVDGLPPASSSSS